MDLARSEKRLIGLNMEICVNLAKEYNRKRFCDLANGKSIPKRHTGKKNYIMLHMLIQQEWKGRSITTCMNVRVGLTDQ